jgi:hypothetical protein
MIHIKHKITTHHTVYLAAMIYTGTSNNNLEDSTSTNYPNNVKIMQEISPSLH